MAGVGTNSLGGVLSGIDYEVLITQTMAVASRPLNTLNARLAQTQAKQSALTSLKATFSAFETQVSSLSDMAALRGVKASTSDQAVVGITGSAGAFEGTHDIEVNQLAAAETRVHAGLASDTAAIGSAAQFVYTYDGVTRTVQTEDTTTLAELVDLINDDSSNPGVQASIIQYDSGDSLAYHLVLRGQQTGADYGITIEASTTLTGFDSGGANWTVSQAARNAQVRIDNYPAGDWIESDTNAVGDLIPNVTLDLKSAGSASIALTRDTAGLRNGLTSLVDAYNAIVNNIDELTGYDEVTETSGIFQGDSTVTGLIHQIRELLITPAAGFDVAHDSYTTPGSIGLEMDKDGQLSLDLAVLDEAMADDYEGVLSLVAAAMAGNVDSSDIQFTSALSSTTAGTYELKVVYDAGGNVSEAYYRTKDGSDDWEAATIDGFSITGADNRAEEGLNVLVVNSQTSQTVTYEVRVKQGFAGALYDTASAQLDSETGAFEVRDDQFDLAISNLQDQIERQEYRLEQREERLRAQYLRMETALAKLESMRGAFDALISSVSSGSDGSS